MGNSSSSSNRKNLASLETGSNTGKAKQSEKCTETPPMFLLPDIVVGTTTLSRSSPKPMTSDNHVKSHAWCRLTPFP